MKRILTPALCAALLLFAAPASAEDRDLYTGKWVLDKEESKLLGDPPAHREMKLVYENETLKINRREVQKDGNVIREEYTYLCNGEPQTIKMPDESEREAKAHWDGAKLVVVSESSRMGMAFTVDTVWELKGDDRLEIHNKLSSAFRNDEWTQVFNRKVSKKK